MSSSTLATWFQTQLNPLYDHSQPSVKELGKSMFAPDAEIWANHEKVAIDTFLDDLQLRSNGSIGAQVEWLHVFENVQVPGSHLKVTGQTIEPVSDEDGPKGGIVAGVFVVTRSLRFLIRAAPATTQACITFSAKISQERKVTQLFYTCIDRQVPIEFPHFP